MTKSYKNLLTPLFIISFFFIFNKFIFAYNQDFEKIQNGQFILPYARLSCECLRFYNLNNAYFPCSFFCCTDFQGASLANANLRYSDFYGADLEETNLTSACLKRSILLNVKLRNSLVKKTDFTDVIGLTNTQKDYLKKNGAINVPKNLTPEEFKHEIETIKEMREVWISKQFKKFFKYLTSLFKNAKQN